MGRREEADTGSIGHASAPWGKSRRPRSLLGAHMTEAFVYDAVRTPRGRGKDTGSLHGTKPISLVVGLIDELRKRNPGLDLDRLSDIVLGVVSPIGDQGSDIAHT